MSPIVTGPTSPVFRIASAGFAGTETDVLPSSVTVPPPGFVPVAQATLSTLPASMSACVSVYVAVKVVLFEAPGASDAIGPPTTVTLGSVTVTLVSVTLPVFVTVKA